jgi:hypothetical protein
MVIAAAIEDCRLMWVFWCSHSQVSREVQEEYLRAVALEKEAVPILLDSTPLPKPLSDFQWIDMRPALGFHDGVIQQVKHVSEAAVSDVIGHFESDGTSVEKSKNADGTWTIRIRAFAKPRQIEIERAGARLQSWFEEHMERGA